MFFSDGFGEDGSLLVDGRPDVMINVDGEEKMDENGSSYNVDEADMVIDLILEIQRKTKEFDASPNRLRIITFYTAQVNLIAKKAREAGLRGISVSTVDSSQGSESDVVIISFVRTGKLVADDAPANPKRAIGFLTDNRRLNVAITRAKFQRICVGDAVHLAKVRGDKAATIRSFVEGMAENSKVIQRQVAPNNGKSSKKKAKSFNNSNNAPGNEKVSKKKAKSRKSKKKQKKKKKGSS